MSRSAGAAAASRRDLMGPTAVMTRDPTSLKIVAFIGVAMVLFLAWRSRSWPLVHDQAIMHYVAWLITQGLVPYRDIFDMNLPGVYLLHLGFGTSSGSAIWRGGFFDLSWTAMTCGLVYAYCRGMVDRWSATSAAALFAVYHLSDGALQAGQRDILIAGLLLAAAYCVVRFSETGRSRFLWCSGGAVGAALTIKPLPGLFWLACAGVAGYGAKRLGQSMSRAVLIVLGAGAVLPGIAFAWVWWMGGRPAFISVQKDYVLPLYAHAGTQLFFGRVVVWLLPGCSIAGARPSGLSRRAACRIHRDRHRRRRRTAVGAATLMDGTPFGRRTGDRLRCCALPASRQVLSVSSLPARRIHVRPGRDGAGVGE